MNIKTTFHLLKWIILIGALIWLKPSFGQAQNSTVEVNTRGKKATIKYLIARIQEMQGIQLSYSEEYFKNLDELIDVPAGDLTSDQLLKLLSQKANLTYKKVGKNIILKPAAQQQYTVSGYVYDELTGESLIGSTVQIANTYIGALSNVYGYFSLDVPAGEVTLLISSVGYGTHKRELNIRADTTIEIRIKPYTKLLARGSGYR